MRLRKLHELDQYNTYLHNRIYEVMAIESSEVPREERTDLQDKLEMKILEKQNFFRTGFDETVELFNKTFCPALRRTDQRVLFLAVQARELIPIFFGQKGQVEMDTWIDERVQKATDLCVSTINITPIVITYTALCPYKPMSVRPKPCREQKEHVERLETEVERLKTLMTRVNELQTKLANNRRVFTALGSVYQRELSDIIRQL